MKPNRRSRKTQAAAARAVQFDALEPRTFLAATRIMPLGDSITEGQAGHASYRWSLYNQLAAAGYDVDFIGNRTGIASGSPLYSNFDQNHQGTSGLRADQVQSSVAGWATLNQPDVVLLHIGTNDILQGQTNTSTVTEIGGIVDNLRTVVPNVKILLAQVIPGTTNASQYALLNSQIATLAGQKNTAQSPVILVDQFTGFSTSSDLYDGIHPDDSGERKVANKWLAALQTILPAPTPPAPVTYLSDLTPTSSSNGWGPVEKDMSNAETASGDGRYIGLNGVGYLKGLGIHSSSQIVYALNGQYTQFLSDIGIDDEAGNNGSVIFQVFLDNAATPIYQSPVLTGSSATVSIPAIDVTGKQSLKLVVTDGGNGNTWDHADWAGARLVSAPVVPPPSAPTNLDAVVNVGQVDLTWIDNATGETGYRVQRKIGVAGTWQQLGGDLPANTQAVSDLTVSAGVTYYYRVLAFNGAVVSAFSNEDNVTTPIPPGTTYVSDLTPTSSSNGWGPFEKDRSNGETGATDGNPITLNGVVYSKGLGFHASAQVVYALNGQYTQFLSDIGIDDEAGNNGSVIFQVFLDNAATPVYQSPTMTGSSATISIPTIDVTGKQSLKLVITDGGNGNTWDHADWANARLVAGPVIPPPATPTNLDAVINGNQVDLTWIDNAGDETGYRVQRKIGIAGAWQQLGADQPANTQLFSDTNVSAGVTYYYRVLAFSGAVLSGFSNEDNVTLPLPAGTTYVSDLTPTSSSNGWGPFEKDRSNGETGATDGNVITLNGVTYAKGLGFHASAQNIYALNGQYTQFLSDIGIDDEAGSNGSVIFQVFLDNVASPVYQSPVMTGSSATISIPTIDVTGVQTLKLVITDGGNGNTWDHADWANARLVSGPVVPAPATPTNLDAVINGNQVDLTWIDNAGDETGYRVQRKIGAGGTWAQLGPDLPANAQGYFDLTVSTGIAYYYRVLAFNGAVVSAFSNEDNVTLPVPPSGTTTYVSDLTPTSSNNGWGPFEKDRSNGETGATDGNVITLNGVTYTKGLGFHASGEVVYALNGQYTQFLSDIGIDDEAGSNGSVIFQVFLDNAASPIYQSPLLTGNSSTISIPAIDVTGKQTLKLVITDGGNGNTWDHADWANARLLSSGPVAPTTWFGDVRHFRQAISINVGASARTDQPLDTSINFTTILNSLGGSGSLIDASIRVVEVSADGSTLIDGAVPFQFDKATGFNAASNAAGTLVILAKGNTAANATRYYQVYFDTVGSFSAPSFTAQVTTTDNDSDQGQVAVKIENQTATYWLQKENGGFSSIVDKNGNDWLGFSPAAGSQSGGEFRGTPNAIFPGGGFHAGFVLGSTQILSTGPLKSTIESTITVAKGTYKMRYEFYNNFVRATMVSAGGTYWFLYEGTPGGNVDANDTVVRSDGTVTGISTAWNDNDGLGTGTGEEWLYFRDSAVDKYIYFVHNTADNLKDSYYRMDVNGSMTVFGFGRDNEAAGDRSLMTAQNQSFTFGIANGGGDFNAASGVIKGQYKVLNGAMGASQANP